MTSATHGKRALFVPRRASALPFLVAILVAIVLLPAPQARATDDSWNGAGTGSNNWNTNTNWSPNTVPTGADNAVFNISFTNQPNISAATTVGGIWMTTGVNKSVTITASGSAALTLNGNTINGTSGLGILVDNTSAFTLTIAAGAGGGSVNLGNAQTWRNNSGNLLTISAAVTTNGKALTVDGSGNTTVSGIASGTGSITKSGIGTLTLSGSNSYSGGTTISQGTLAITTSANALGSGTVTMNGGTLDLGGLTLGSTTRLINVTSNGGTFSASLSSTITNKLNNGTGASSSTTLTKTGSSTLLLNGDDSGFTGQWSVTAGTLSLDGAQTPTTSNNAITLSSTGSLALSASANTTKTVTIGSLSGSGSGTISPASSQTNATTALVVTQSTDGSASNVIQDNNTTKFALTKAGAAKLTLTGANTYTGATTIDAGILSATTLANGGTSSSIGQSTNAAANLVFGGGTLQYTGSALANTDRLFTIGDANGLTATIDSSGSLNALSFTNPGALAYGGSGARTLTLTGSNTSTNSFAPSIADGTGGATSLVKSGASVWTVTGNNSYTGGTTVSAGLLKAGSSTALGSSSGTLTMSGGNFDLNDNNISIGNLTGVSGTNIWNNSGANTATLTIGSNNTGGGTYAGVIQDINPSSGSTGKVALTKTGNGTITLSGANAYTGATNVNGGGALFINGNQSAATGAVTVTGSGTTLGGSGKIGGSVTVNSGSTSNNNLTPGATAAVGNVATLSTGALTLHANTNLNIDITGAGGIANAGVFYDQVSVIGTVTVGAPLDLSNLVVSASGLTNSNIGQAFFIVANDGIDAVNGTFTQGVTVTSGSDVFTIDYAADFGTGALVGGNDIALVLTAVPEPGTWIAAALALLSVGYFQRKRLGQILKRASLAAAK